MNKCYFCSKKVSGKLKILVNESFRDVDDCVKVPVCKKCLEENCTEDNIFT